MLNGSVGHNQITIIRLNYIVTRTYAGQSKKTELYYENCKKIKQKNTFLEQ